MVLIAITHTAIPIKEGTPTLHKVTLMVVSLAITPMVKKRIMDTPTAKKITDIRMENKTTVTPTANKITGTPMENKTTVTPMAENPANTLMESKTTHHVTSST